MFLSVNLFLSMLVLCLCLCCACVGVSVLCFVRRLRKVQTVPFICFYPKVFGLTELQTVQLDNPSNRAGSKTEAFQISKQSLS